MAVRFTPCPVCARHVREGDAACPFCGATSLPLPPLSRVPSTRLSRAAFLALGAAAALAATDCSSTSSPTPEPAYGGGPVPVVDSGSMEGDSGNPGSVQPLYGAVAPTPDAGSGSGSGAGAGDAEPEREGGFAQPLYGAIAPMYGTPVL